MTKKSSSLKLSKRKKRLFKVGAVFMAFLFLIIMELLLRAVGYGKDYPLFIEDLQDESKLIMNPEIGQKYFFNPENATKGLPRPFDKIKKEGAFRVVIMGASTAVGYPYKYHGGFQHWLEYALNRSYPNQNIEIINTALTAVNSYTLLDVTEDIVAQEPDLVLIYAGHNEYYGALGVGSTSSLGNSPWIVRLMLSLREVRLVQLITNGILSLKGDEDKQTTLNKNLMEKMVEDQKIPLDSDLYQAGINQFENNLEDLLSILKEHDVPTYLSTIVSNEKDIKPFISDSIPSETSANYYYRQGTANFYDKNYVDAKSDFVMAKELDLLRFRAPEAMNAAIKTFANEFSNVILIDSKSNFENKTEHQIIGDHLLLEHVHPNTKGYAIIAHSFYEAIVASNMLTGLDKKFTLEDLEFEMPVTALDSLEGHYEVLMLKDGWPYFEPFPKMDVQKMSVPEQIAGQLAVNKMNWQKATLNLYEYYNKNGDSLNALKVLESVTLTYPNESVNFLNAGRLAAQLNMMNKALYLFDRAAKIDGSNQTLGAISKNLIESNHYSEALSYLILMKSQEDEGGFAHQVFTVVTNILRLKNDQSALLENSDLKIELAKNYLLIGKRKEALLSLKSVLEDDPNHVLVSQMINDMQK